MICTPISLYSLPENESMGLHSESNLWVTIFIHGIMSIKPYLSLSNTIRLIRDDVEDTLYSKTVEMMRLDPFFYKNQAMQGFGLEKINLLDTTKGNASAALAQLFEMISYYTGLPQKTHDYYTYGWSGLLSAKSRSKDALTFFQELEELVCFYKKKGSIPSIRIIGYSHGGNIALNLAAIRCQKYPCSQLIIDELILLGTPIIHESTDYIYDPMFKKIYNIYSKQDRVQVLDIFSATQSCFSKRLFKPSKYCPLPANLTQIEIKIMRTQKTKKHRENRSKITQHPHKYHGAYCRTRLLRNASPGHGELWFFGWTPYHYRTNYPLYPLPTISLAPFITYHVEHTSPKTACSKPVVVDIRPEHEIVIIKNKAQATYTVIPFLDQGQLNHLQETALFFKPECYTDDLYHYHVENAYKQILDYQANKIQPIYKRMLRRYNNRKKRIENGCVEQ